MLPTKPRSGKRFCSPSDNQLRGASETATELILLFWRYRRVLRDYVLCRVRRAQDVDDLVQSVFLNLSRVRDLGQVRHVERYLFRVASRVVSASQISARRNACFISTDSETVDHLLETPERPERDALPDALHFERELTVAFAKLPPRQQALLALACEGLTYDEIAARSGLSRDQVERGISAAHELMKSLLWDL